MHLLCGFQKHSLHSLKETLRAFRSAVHGALDMVEKDKLSTKLTFKVEGDTGMIVGKNHDGESLAQRRIRNCSQLVADNRKLSVGDRNLKACCQRFPIGFLV